MISAGKHETANKRGEKLVADVKRGKSHVSQIMIGFGLAHDWLNGQKLRSD